MIRNNLERIQERITESCKRSGRHPEEIRVLAVTKNVPIEVISEGIRAGLTHLGESKVQEALEKASPLQSPFPPLRWHMIGHLQTNKVNRACEVFNCIQSLDSEKLAQAIDRRAGELGKVQDCLIEVKVSEEPAKFGAPEEEVDKLLQVCGRLENIRLKGLMCMAPYFEDSAKARPYFAKAKKIFDRNFSSSSLNDESSDVLSMGMSQDFEAAIEEGSTMVRIGTALFGARNTAV